MKNSDEFTPVLPMGDYMRLRRAFNMSEIASHPPKGIKNNDELVGYMRGATDVLNLARQLANAKEDLDNVLAY